MLLQVQGPGTQGWHSLGTSLRYVLPGPAPGQVRQRFWTRLRIEKTLHIVPTYPCLRTAATTPPFWIDHTGLVWKIFSNRIPLPGWKKTASSPSPSSALPSQSHMERVFSVPTPWWHCAYLDMTVPSPLSRSAQPFLLTGPHLAYLSSPHQPGLDGHCWWTTTTTYWKFITMCQSLTRTIPWEFYLHSSQRLYEVGLWSPTYRKKISSCPTHLACKWARIPYLGLWRSELMLFPWHQAVLKLPSKDEILKYSQKVEYVQRKHSSRQTKGSLSQEEVATGQSV